MDEGLNHLYEDNFGLNSSLNKFKEMLQGSEPRFFDVQEFEDIIEYYTDQQNYNYADRAIHYANRIHPFSSALKLKEARLHIEKGSFNQALKVLKTVEALEHTNHDFHLLKGLAYFSLNEVNAAHNCFETAIDYAEEIEDKEDVAYQIAINILQIEKYEDAIPYLLKSYECNNSNLLVIYELASTYESIANYQESAKFYLEYLEVEPFSESIWNGLGIVYSENKELDKALEAFDYAIAINPMYTSPYINKANTFIKFNKNKLAIDIYEELITLDISNAQNYYLIGECYEKSNNMVKALEYYSRAKEIDETYSDAWFGIGNIYAQLNDHKNCVKYFEKAISYDEENPDFWFNVGVAYAKLNKFDKSLIAFERVILIDKYDVEAWIEQVKVLEQQKKLNDAILVLNQAYQYNYDNALVSYHLAKLYFLSNQIKLSLKYFTRGLELDFSAHWDILKENPSIFEHSQFIDLIKKYA